MSEFEQRVQRRIEFMRKEDPDYATNPAFCRRIAELRERDETEENIEKKLEDSDMPVPEEIARTLAVAKRWSRPDSFLRLKAAVISAGYVCNESAVAKAQCEIATIRDAEVTALVLAYDQMKGNPQRTEEQALDWVYEHHPDLAEFATPGNEWTRTPRPRVEKREPPRTIAEMTSAQIESAVAERCKADPTRSRAAHYELFLGTDRGRGLLELSGHPDSHLEPGEFRKLHPPEASTPWSPGNLVRKYLED
jgi:hypothetical protein